MIRCVISSCARRRFASFQLVLNKLRFMQYKIRKESTRIVIVDRYSIATSPKGLVIRLDLDSV